MSCEKYFLKKLREQGFRLTPQREMVLSVMHRIEGFATVEEIYEQVQAISSSVDISTVYRTLDLLRDFHLVVAVDPGDGQRRYELLGIHGEHLHLVCQSCGKIIGVDLDQAQPFTTCLKERYGFTVDLDNWSIPGLCQECEDANTIIQTTLDR